MKYQLYDEPFDPIPLPQKGLLEGNENEKQLMAIDIESKYYFVDSLGNKLHQYLIPSDRHIHNLGGYVDKLIQYKDHKLLDYFKQYGLSEICLSTDMFPILDGRSPRLDRLLSLLIVSLYESNGGQRVSLFDIGCTVAEHYDLIDIMLKANTTGEFTADKCMEYHGLDNSALLLAAAYLLHKNIDKKHFDLIMEEGSSYEPPKKKFDFSLSVGVLNHTNNALVSLQKMLYATKFAAVIALWVTLEDKGYWAMNHSGVPYYFFSRQDLEEAEREHSDGFFYFTEFIPENDSSQVKGYVGLGLEKEKKLGCYHLIFSRMNSLPFKVHKLF